MKAIELEVSNRTEIGKGPNRRLRAKGQIPAVLYGASKSNFNIQTQTKFMAQIINQHSENAIITLKCGDKKINGKHVLIKDWDRNIMTRQPQHVDFYEVDMTKPVQVKVALQFTGKAKGVADGGLVSPIVREIEVECLPSVIPEHIIVDVTALGVGDSIHIEELAVPEGVKKLFTDNYTLVTCTYIKEEVLTPVTPAEGTVAEPEVIAKGKKDEEGDGAAAGKDAKTPAAAKAAPAKGGDKK